jgi:hypothetical protein
MLEAIQHVWVVPEHEVAAGIDDSMPYSDLFEAGV